MSKEKMEIALQFVVGTLYGGLVGVVSLFWLWLVIGGVADSTATSPQVSSWMLRVALSAAFLAVLFSWSTLAGCLALVSFWRVRSHILEKVSGELQHAVKS